MPGVTSTTPGRSHQLPLWNEADGVITHLQVEEPVPAQRDAHKPLVGHWET